MICKSLFIYWYFVVYLLHLFLSYLSLYLYLCFLPLPLPLSLSYCRAAMNAFEKICNCHDISIAVSWQYYLQQVQAILLLYESKSWILKKCDRKNIDIVELCCSKITKNEQPRKQNQWFCQINPVFLLEKHMIRLNYPTLDTLYEDLALWRWLQCQER